MFPLLPLRLTSLLPRLIFYNLNTNTVVEVFEIEYCVEKTTKNQNILRKCSDVLSIKSKWSKKKLYQLAVIKSDTV